MPATYFAASAATNAPAYRYTCGAFRPYTDSSGNTWVPLQNGGTPFDYASIGYPSPAPDAELYSTVTYGQNNVTAITVPLPDGTYSVTGSWREVFKSSAGERVQSLRVAGVSSNLFTNVDGWRADRAPVVLTAGSLVTVSGGSGLVLELLAVVDTPVIAALQFTLQ